MSRETRAEARGTRGEFVAEFGGVAEERHGRGLASEGSGPVPPPHERRREGREEGWGMRRQAAVVMEYHAVRCT